MAVLPVRTVVQGNPPSPLHQVDPRQLADLLEQIQSQAATSGALIGFAATASGLNAIPGAADGKYGGVLTDGADGGIYLRSGGVWTRVAPLPTIMTESLGAELSRAYATSDKDVEADPSGHPGEYSARHWAITAQEIIESVDSLANLQATAADIDAIATQFFTVEGAVQTAQDAADAAQISAQQAQAAATNSLSEAEVTTIATDVATTVASGTATNTATTVATDTATSVATSVATTVATDTANSIAGSTANTVASGLIADLANGDPGSPKIMGKALDIGIGNLSGTTAIVGLDDVASLLLVARDSTSGTSSDVINVYVGYQLTANGGSSWSSSITLANGSFIGNSTISSSPSITGATIVNMTGYNGIRLTGGSGCAIWVKGE